MRTALYLILIYPFIPICNASAQVQLSWDDLYDVRFVGESENYLKPVFGKSLTFYDGEEVYISGYVIPLDFQQNIYVISAYPNASCFFCGGAGPESVMELQLKNARRNYRMDEWKRFKGKLCLNKDDENHLHYILEYAEEY